MRKSPSDSPLERRVQVEFNDDIPRYWANGDPMVSSFFSALSTIFPDGERFFIHSVRNYLDSIDDPKLKQDVLGFVGQEVSHGRVHKGYNAWLERLGYPVASPIAKTKHALLWFRKAPPILQVAFTVAFEHFTAIFGESMISELPEIQQEIEAWHPVMRQVWLWHGYEENEHKAVAFDVYQHAGGGYLLRVACLCVVSLYIWAYLSWLTASYLRADGKLTFSVVAKGFNTFWLKPGLFRRMAGPWLQFFKPGFHPWQRDNREQLARLLERLEQDGFFEQLAKAA